MKRIHYQTLFFTLAAFCLANCAKEKTPEAAWRYPGPFPAITNGPSNAQKLCYELYQKYDLHVYYNLSGDEALRSDVGNFQTASMANSASPCQASDEDSGERFLKLLKGFLSLLPDQMASSGPHRRHVLVKINPTLTAQYVDELGNPYLACTANEDGVGILLYGYLASDNDTNNTLFSNVEGWKWNICYQFFRGSVTSLRRESVPEDFEIVCAQSDYRNAAYYTSSSGTFNRANAKSYGFVHPFGALSATAPARVFYDWGSYVAWILTTPYTERSADIEAYPRIKTRYNAVMEYYKTTFNIDLETISTQYRALSI